MRTIHANFAYVVVLANLTIGAWGLLRWYNRKDVPRGFWIALGGAWATIYVQGLLGLVIFNRYHPPFKHHFYGFLFVIITLAVWPLRSEEPRRRLVAFSASTLFIGIVAVRAIFSCRGC